MSGLKFTDEAARQLEKAYRAEDMGVAAAAAISLLPENATEATEDAAIRSFRVNVPDEQLADLRRRIAATRWPDRETVNDQSQGAQLAKLQELVRYWGTDYDWRKCEARLNALPQFMFAYWVFADELIG